MEPRPNYRLCFLGKFGFISAQLFLLVSIGAIPTKPELITLLVLITLFNSLWQTGMDTARWKNRFTHLDVAPQKKRKWLPVVLLGILYLLIVEGWQYYRPTPTPQLRLMALLLVPAAVALNYYLNNLGIELPLRRFQEKQEEIGKSELLHPRVSIAPEEVKVQQVGR